MTYLGQVDEGGRDATEEGEVRVRGDPRLGPLWDLLRYDVLGPRGNAADLGPLRVWHLGRVRENILQSSGDLDARAVGRVPPAKAVALALAHAAHELFPHLLRVLRRHRRTARHEFCDGGRGHLPQLLTGVLR